MTTRRAASRSGLAPQSPPLRHCPVPIGERVTAAKLRTESKDSPETRRNQERKVGPDEPQDGRLYAASTTRGNQTRWLPRQPALARDGRRSSQPQARRAATEFLAFGYGPSLVLASQSGSRTTGAVLEPSTAFPRLPPQCSTGSPSTPMPSHSLLGEVG